MQLNTQPVEGPDQQKDGSLDVHSVWLTLQGEGPFSGRPAVFVRLAGCNLSSTCHFCDTDYTSNRKRMSANELFEKIEETTPTTMRECSSHPLVVFTGGEPLRQNLKSILLILQHNDFAFQIETNGTYPPIDLDWWDAPFYVISPKTPKINHDIQTEAAAFKYVIEAGHVDPTDGLPTRALGGLRPARPGNRFEGSIYLQPCDEKDHDKNKANQDAALESCMKHGYRLSLQLHKLLGLE